MKISRKVAKRKYSRRSFVSRRRLRNKKHKKHHTQKGGKYGNRIRTRAYKRTHKRGKRFHRGGEGVEFTCPTIQMWQTKTDNNVKLGISEAVVSSVTLFFIKKGSFTFKPVSGNFNITLRVYNSPVYQPEILPYTPLVFEVTFKRNTDSRDDNNSVTFSITNLGDFTDKEALKNLVRKESSGEEYNFSFSMNDDTFKSIQECVRQKLKEVYEKLEKLLSFCIGFQKDTGTSIKCDTTQKNINAPPEVEDATATPEDEQNVNNFLDSMFNPGSQYITANLQRLRLLASKIVALLSYTQNDVLYNTDYYFPNLNMALNEFGDVYRRINHDTQNNNSDYVVQAQPIHA